MMKKDSINKKNIVALIQARMDSTRLPGKVMKMIDGEPMIYRICQALEKSKMVKKIVVVTSENKDDDKLVDFLRKNKIKYFRGSKNDVLERYYQAAKKFSADLIVRITGDCPLIDPAIVDLVIKEAINYKVDYASNVQKRSFPRGYDVEVLTNEALQKIHGITKDPDDREHVSLYIRRNPDLFKIKNILAPDSKYHPKWRVCVDTKEDFQLVKKIFQTYRKKDLIQYDDVISFFVKHPDIIKINKHIKQKKIKNRNF